MKHTTTQRSFDIMHISVMPSGYGHYKVTVDLLDESSRQKSFIAVTTDLRTIDEVQRQINEGEISYKERNQLLFEAIENSIEGSLTEWLEEEI